MVGKTGVLVKINASSECFTTPQTSADLSSAIDLVYSRPPDLLKEDMIKQQALGL